MIHVMIRRQRIYIVLIMMTPHHHRIETAYSALDNDLEWLADYNVIWTFDAYANTVFAIRRLSSQLVPAKSIG